MCRLHAAQLVLQSEWCDGSVFCCWDETKIEPIRDKTKKKSNQSYPNKIGDSDSISIYWLESKVKSLNYHLQKPWKYIKLWLYIYVYIKDTKSLMILCIFTSRREAPSMNSQCRFFYLTAKWPFIKTYNWLALGWKCIWKSCILVLYIHILFRIFCPKAHLGNLMTYYILRSFLMSSKNYPMNEW